MPEDLLQELETPNSVAGTLEGIEDLVREAMRRKQTQTGNADSPKPSCAHDRAPCIGSAMQGA